MCKGYDHQSSNSSISDSIDGQSKLISILDSTQTSHYKGLQPIGPNYVMGLSLSNE